MKKDYIKPAMTLYALAPTTLMAYSSSLNKEGTEAGYDTEEKEDLWESAMAKIYKLQQEMWEEEEE